MSGGTVVKPNGSPTYGFDLWKGGFFRVYNAPAGANATYINHVDLPLARKWCGAQVTIMSMSGVDGHFYVMTTTGDRPLGMIPARADMAAGDGYIYLEGMHEARFIHVYSTACAFVELVAVPHHDPDYGDICAWVVKNYSNEVKWWSFRGSGDSFEYLVMNSYLRDEGNIQHTTATNDLRTT